MLAKAKPAPVPYHRMRRSLKLSSTINDLPIVADAKLAKSIDSALLTDAAYLDAFITAEEAAVEDRIVAELLSRGEALRVPKSQTRLENPKFIMDPELITVYV